MLLVTFIQLFSYGQATVKGKSIYYVSNYSESNAKRYFDTAGSLDPIEGIWISNGIKYSIEKDYNGYSRNNEKYRIVVLTEKKDWVWQNGDILYFLVKGASESVFEVTHYSIVADWSSGNRKYGVRPVLGVGILANSVSFTAQLPNFDDYGNEIGSVNDNFIKVYPRN